MLSAVDLAAHRVLLAVHLRLLRAGEFAAVGGPVRGNFVIDVGFALFQTRGLSSIQTAAFDALGEAVLLVLAALTYLGGGLGNIVDTFVPRILP
jgi:hypothetical protein